MKCACCGRKKKLLESFEDIGKGGNVCVDCSDILYCIHDAFTEKNNEEYDLRTATIKNKIKTGKTTKEFNIWFDTDFLIRNPIPQK